MRRTTQIRYTLGPAGPANNSAGGLLGRIVAFVVGIGILGVAIFLGAIFIAAVLGLMLIGGLIVMIRVWWIKRQIKQHERNNGDLSAEYTVVDDRTDIK